MGFVFYFNACEIMKTPLLIALVSMLLIVSPHSTGDLEAFPSSVALPVVQWARLFRFLLGPAESRVVAYSAERMAVRSALQASEMRMAQAAEAKLIQTSMQGSNISVRNLTDDFISIELNAKNSNALLEEYIKNAGFADLPTFQKSVGLKQTGIMDEATIESSLDVVKHANKIRLMGLPKSEYRMSAMVKDLIKSNSIKSESRELSGLSATMFNRTELAEIQNILKFNGYYKGAIDGSWSQSLDYAINAFSKMPNPSKDLFRRAIESERTIMLRNLESVGFKGASLENAIKNFQKFRGEVQSGILTNNTMSALKNEIEVSTEIQKLAASSKTPYKYLLDCKRLTSRKSSIASFQRMDDSFYTIVENTTYSSPKTEVWVWKNSMMKRYEGNTFYKDIIASSKGQLAAKKSKAKIVSILPEKAEGQAYVIARDREFKILEDDIIWEDLKEFDEIFAANNSGPKQQWIINRSLYDRAIKKIDDEAYKLTEFGFNNEELYHVLNQKYGRYNDFFLDDELDIAISNIDNIPKLFSIQDIQILFSEYGKIEDDQILNGLKDNYGKYVDLFSKKIVPGKANVVLVTGHKSDELRNFITKHGNAGNLKNRTLVVLSCFDSADANFFSDLIKKYGIREVVYFPYELKSSSVEIILDELIQAIERESGTGKYLHDLLRKAVEKAIEDPLNRINKSELEKLLYSIKQVSGLKINELNIAA